MHKVRGFTLIEILIVVIIVGILATLAQFSYRTYTTRANRIDMQQTMQTIAQQMQAYKAGNNFSYTNATFASSSSVGLVNSTTAISSQYPASNPLYTLVLTVPDNIVDPAGSSWRLTATPVLTGAQKGNGILVITDQGWTCWNKTNTCAPSSTTTWDGK